MQEGDADQRPAISPAAEEDQVHDNTDSQGFEDGVAAVAKAAQVCNMAFFLAL